jgi:hypothetical protein
MGKSSRWAVGASAVAFGALASATAGAQVPDGDDRAFPRPADPAAERLRGAGLEAYLGDYERFARLSRTQQRHVLEASGLRDPGTSMDRGDTRDYLLGQWLRATGADVPLGIDLTLQSGLLPPRDAVALLTSLGPDDIPVSDGMVADTLRAFPHLSREQARNRARVQKIGNYLAPALKALRPGYTGVRVEDHPSPHLVVMAAPAASPGAVEPLAGVREVAGATVVDEAVPRSESDLRRLHVEVRRRIQALAPGARLSSSTDPRSGSVQVVFGEPFTLGASASRPGGRHTRRARRGGPFRRRHRPERLDHRRPRGHRARAGARRTSVHVGVRRLVPGPSPARHRKALR